MKDDFLYRSSRKSKYIFLLNSVLVGVGAGVLSVVYRFLISRTDILRKFLFSDNSIKSILINILLALIIAIIVSSLLKIAPLSGGSGIPQIRAELLGRVRMDEKKTLFSKITGGTLVNILGLSLGREGPSIQLGGAFGKFISNLFKRGSTERSYLITAGASAGLAAAFNAPLAATLFALEEIHKSFSKYILVSCITASIVANYISFSIFGLENSFSFTVKEQFSLNQIWIPIVIGIVSALAGTVFNNGILKTQKILQRLRINNIFKIFLVLLFGIFVCYNLFEITGGGHGLIENLSKNRLSIKFLLILLIGKYLFTFLSYGSGVQGGIFLPVLVIGAITGAIIFEAFNNFIDNIYYINFIILGMAGVLCAVVRSPIMCLLLIVEMVGSVDYLLPISICVITAYFGAEFLRVEPIYESLYEGIIKKFARGVEFKEANHFVKSYKVTNHCKLRNVKLCDINFGGKFLIAYINRDNGKFIPNGNDIILVGDELEIVVDDSSIEQIENLLNGA